MMSQLHYRRLDLKNGTGRLLLQTAPAFTNPQVESTGRNFDRKAVWLHY